MNSTAACNLVYHSSLQ